MSATSEQPQQESRVKKTLLNAKVNLVFYFLTLVLSFFSRKIFLDCLGAEFIGFTGTLQNLLGFLNLAELGIGASIGYLLYKPIYDKDHTKINEIISVMGYLYRWIGIIILVAGCVLACFIPFIYPSSETGFSYSLTYFAFFSFLTASLIGYFINYRQNLLGADQRNYVVTGYFQTTNIVKTVVQMVLAYWTGNYFLWVAIELTFGVIYSFILNWKINQTYPWLKADIRLGKKVFKKYPEVMTKTKQLFVHKISAFIQFQTTPFLTYLFVSLQVVAYYGNYTIITMKIQQLLQNFLGSVSASVGNLIAEGNNDKSLRIFWELFAIRFFIASVVCFSIFMTINAFITLWLGSQYLLPTVTVFLLLVFLFIDIFRGATEVFVFGFGLFQDTWAPITESVIFLVAALIGGHFLGLNGIILASIISLVIIICIWKPYFLFSKGFKISVWVYWRGFAKYFFLSVGMMILCYVVISKLIPINPAESWIKFIIYSCIVAAISAVAYVGVFYPLTQGTRDAFTRFLKKKR